MILCPLCNTEMVEKTGCDILIYHYHACPTCFDIEIMTQEDQKKTLESAKHSIGNVVVFSKESVSRFNTLSTLKDKKFKILSANIIEGYATFDLQDGDDFLSNVNADMFTNNFPLNIGDTVVFHQRMFDKPYVEYYNEYSGHQFKVIGLHYEDTHYELECITGDITVKGYVHRNELCLI